LTSCQPPDYILCMVGKIRTKEKCPRCLQKFEGEPLKCPKCKIPPSRYYIDLYWKKQIKLYRDQDGYLLTSWEQASRFLAHIRYEIDRSQKSAGKFVFDPKNYVRQDLKALQFENYILAWLIRREREVGREQLSRGYLRSTKSYISNHMTPFFRDSNIREINEGMVEDFRDQLPMHLRSKTVANILGVLRKILQDAHRRRDIERLPYFPRVEIGDPDIKWLEEEDQLRILENIADPVRRAFFIFSFHQVTRPGEARALRWERVDFKRNRVVIAAAMDEETYREHTKERDIRELPMHEEVRAALEALPSRALSGFVFTFRGKPFNHKLIYKTWRRAAEQAGIDINCYQGTRHSGASQAINAGVDHKIIQGFLGHKDPRSTAKYAHLRTETLKGFWKRDYPQSSPDEKVVNDKILQFKGKID
jgi:integrase